MIGIALANYADTVGNGHSLAFDGMAFGYDPVAEQNLSCGAIEKTAEGLRDDGRLQDRLPWTAEPGRHYITDMAIKRLDHVSVVVEDLAAAVAFFTLLGMTVDGEMPIEGAWVDRVNGIEGIQVDIVMMRTPDGHGRLELTRFRNPKLVDIEPALAPPNALGLRSIMFTVDSVDDDVARLREHGAELIGEVVQYEDMYRLCYLRGPAGIIVALAEELF